MDFIKGQRRETARKGQYKILWGVLALGILMRLIYVLYTPYTMGQHDTMELGSGSGHFGYIEYFLEKNIKRWDKHDEFRTAKDG